ncbi:MAG: hypothetical protein B6D41_08140 [Chloroflexi bacterium UTCFX4]|nr:MAG: hypothetical protein B6D41_08140 [Chloroflexi bacterium UTCFX4]
MELSFARDIRPLIRESDVECMVDYGLDLSSLSEVRMYAEQIYRALAEKRMPEDIPWNDENIAKFKRWMDEGMDA